MDRDEEQAAKERAQLAWATISAQLQHADSSTVLAVALEHHTLTMNEYISAMNEHIHAMQLHGGRLEDFGG